MPFTSKRQQAAAFAGAIPGFSKEKALEWAHETPNLKDLPDRAPAEKGKPTLRSKKANGDMLQYFADHPDKLREKKERDKKANYKLEGEREFRGLDIAIENKKGTERKWYDPHGKEAGSTHMHFDYGYIRLTKGTDGDHVDVYVGPDEDAENVYLVDQMKKPPGEIKKDGVAWTKFDEQKCMLGFKTEAEAKAAYMKQYDDPRFFGAIKTMPFEEFKTKVLDKKNHGEKISMGRDIAPAQEETLGNKAKRLGAVGATGAGAAYTVTPAATERLLGAQRFVHGTSEQAAAKIQQVGLDPRHGGSAAGSGAAIGSQTFVNHSKGKVHVATPAGLPIAAAHARLADTKAKVPNLGREEGMLAYMNPFNKHQGKVLGGAIPYDHFIKHFEEDPDLKGGSAFRTAKRIGAEHIGDNSFMSNMKLVVQHGAEDLPGYIKAHPGRFAGGAALAGAGIAAPFVVNNMMKPKKKLAFTISPAALTGLQHAGVGAGIGAVAGGIGGAMHADPGHRLQGAGRGALAGSALGAAGGAGIAAIKSQGAQQLSSLRAQAGQAELGATEAHRALQSMPTVNEGGLGSASTIAAKAAPAPQMGAGTVVGKRGVRGGASGAPELQLGTQAKQVMHPEAWGAGPRPSMQERGLAEQVAASRGGQAEALRQAAGNLETQQAAMNHGLNRGALVGAAAGTGLMGYMAVPHQYGGVSGQPKIAISADAIRTRAVQGLAGRGISLDRQGQAQIARKAVGYARSLETNGAGNSDVARKELRDVLDKFKSMPKNTHRSRPGANGKDPLEGMSPEAQSHLHRASQFMQNAPPAALGFAPGIVTGIQRNAEETDLKRDLRRARRGDEVEERPESPKWRAADHATQVGGLAYPGVLMGGLGGAIGDAVRHTIKPTSKFSPALTVAGAIGGGVLGGGMGHLIHKSREKRIDKLRSKIVDAQQPKAASESRADTIKDRMEDLGLGVLAAPAASHLAEYGTRKLMLRGGRLGGIAAMAHGPAEAASNFFHRHIPEQATELGGLIALAPGVVHPIAKGIDKMLPKHTVDPEALKSAEDIGRHLARGKNAGMLGTVGNVANAVGSAAWRNRGTLAGLGAVGAVGAGLYGAKKTVDAATSLATTERGPARYAGVPPGMRPPAPVSM